MPHHLKLGIAIVAGIAITGVALAQSDSNSAPNPYREDSGWAKHGAGRNFGSTPGLALDRDGKSLWVFDRCGGQTCENSNIDPITKYDASGRVVTTFGAKMFVRPHGITVDNDGNVWVTDGVGIPPKNGKPGMGHTVVKLSPEGKVIMTLGTPGVTGEDATHFNAPSDVLIAPNGDIFVADGHGEKTNARIVKFDKTGKFIKAWGKEGTGQGEFNEPHGLAMDSQGRLFVADRANSRIQIFDQDGKFLAEWRQFGRPSGIAIDRNDVIYVADSQSDEKTNPGFKQGIRIGNAKDGKVTAYIPETKDFGSEEATAYDDAGNVYAGYTGAMNLKRFVKK
jgi:sugar lactone lactonase YvrE